MKQSEKIVIIGRRIELGSEGDSCGCHSCTHARPTYKMGSKEQSHLVLCGQMGAVIEEVDCGCNLWDLEVDIFDVVESVETFVLPVPSHCHVNPW